MEEMAEKECVKKLKMLKDDYTFCTSRRLDRETYHVEADAILVEFLRKNGFNSVADQYEEMSSDFWYA